jgi:4-amino-4-deoxy-L-arabinose transferase-like glycosyltransferase
MIKVAFRPKTNSSQKLLSPLLSYVIIHKFVVGFLLVTGLAFLLRLTWNLTVHTYPISDFAWYHERAVGLIQGEGYSFHGKPTAYWPIGYPLFLAVLYKVFGAHFYVAKAFNIMMSSATVGLTFLLGRNLCGFAGGLCAGILLAILPSQIEWTSVLCSEVLYTFLLVSSLYMFTLKRPDQQNWLHPLACGVLLGLACLVRAASLLLPVFLWLLYLFFTKNFKRGVVLGTILVTSTLLTISPLTIRNYIVFKSFIPVSTNGGMNLWQGNNPNATGGYYWPSDPKSNPLVPYLNDEVKRDQIARKLALDFICNNPDKFLKLGLVKLYYYYKEDTSALSFSLNPTYPRLSEEIKLKITSIANRYYQIFMLISIFGAVACFLRKKHLNNRFIFYTAIIVISYFTVVHFVFPAMDRYRFPIMPVFSLFAGLGLKMMLNRFVFLWAKFLHLLEKAL